MNLLPETKKRIRVVLIFAVLVFLWIVLRVFDSIAGGMTLGISIGAFSLFALEEFGII